MIKLIVNNQELSIVTQKVVSGTHDYLTVEADFKGSTWDGLRKWVHFTMGEFNYILPMLDDAIAEDQHLDLTEGTWEVYVHGNLIEDDEVTERITTDIKYLYVDAPHDGHPFPPLTPDFEELLANQVAEANEKSSAIWNLYEQGKLTDGATFLPDVDEEGNISWTNDKDKQNPETRNIMGPQGEKGDSGVYIGVEEPTDPDVNVWINPNGRAGKLITKVESTGTHAPGTWDSYTLSFSDNTELEIRVYNGADGSGAGDMVKATYDPTGKNQDVFTYADNAAGAVKDKTAQTGLLKGDGAAITPAVAGEDYVAPSALKPVATSGSYNDLTDKPTIPAGSVVDAALSDNSTNPVQNKVIKQAIDGITTRPNPNALTVNVNGSAAVVYDGSEAKTLNIDTSGSGGSSDNRFIKRTIWLSDDEVTFAVNEAKSYTKDISYSGYTPIGVVGIIAPHSDTYWTIPVAWYISGNLFVARIGNLTGGTLTTTFRGQIQVIYQKD